MAVSREQRAAYEKGKYLATEAMIDVVLAHLCRRDGSFPRKAKVRLRELVVEADAARKARDSTRQFETAEGRRDLAILGGYCDGLGERIAEFKRIILDNDLPPIDRWRIEDR